MKRMTYKDLVDTFVIYNENNGITQQFDERGLKGVIVFSQDNWKDKQYSEKSRSYEVISSNKYFMPNMLGNSIFGNCLDGTDQMIRLDWYDWKVDYCYLVEE